MDNVNGPDSAPISPLPARVPRFAGLRKHRKWILWTCFGIVFLVVVVLVAAVLSIDLLAKLGVERAGTRALGVTTTLDAIKIGILSGDCKLTGFQVANPPGFESSYFLRLDQGGLELPFAKLMGDVVEIDQLTLSGVHLNLVREAEKLNFRTIVESIRQFEAARKSPEGEASDNRGRKRFIIHEVVIQDINVDVNLLPFGGKLGQLAVPIEEIRLQDVGSESSKGENLARITATVIRALLDAVLAKGDAILPPEMRQELTEKLSELKPLETLQKMRGNMREFREERRERREEQEVPDRSRGPMRQRLRARAQRRE